MFGGSFALLHIKLYITPELQSYTFVVLCKLTSISVVHMTPFLDLSSFKAFWYLDLDQKEIEYNTVPQVQSGEDTLLK